MGILDRFRKKKARRRSYAGVNNGRLFADFASMTRSSDAELKPALRILRNRCRELSRNDEYVRRYLQLLRTNVVGPTGVSVQCKARNADGSLDAPGNRIVERAWKAWAKRGICSGTITGFYARTQGRDLSTSRRYRRRAISTCSTRRRTLGG
jgi:capsid protein